MITQSNNPKSTETVCTVQKTRLRDGKEPCFTILSAIRSV